MTIFGKTWDLHVREVLRTSLEENLRMIQETVAYIKRHGKEVIYDAEHFFDGYKENPEYALETLRTAIVGGADAIVLCDTNGGCLPWEIGEAVDVVRREVLGQTDGDDDAEIPASEWCWASMPTTTAIRVWPTRWRQCSMAARTFREPSTATVNDVATLTWSASSPTCS